MWMMLFLMGSGESSMTLNSSLTSLMDAARKYYQINRKLDLNTLTSMLSPNENLIDNSDDFSGSNFVNTSPSRVKLSSREFYGLTVYDHSANSDGHGIQWNNQIKAGSYVFSVFIYCDVDTTIGKNALDVSQIYHIPFSIKKGWNRYVIPFTINSDASSLLLATWVSSAISFAGYKLESGSVATPYLKSDGTLVKAPEVVVG